MVFPGQNLPLPNRPFPFDPSSHALPAWVPDCHLDRTVIPCLPSYDSLGVFHSRMIRFLASFANMVSRSNNRSCLATTNLCLSSFPAYSLKAGYTAHSNTILCTALQVLTRPVREEGFLRRSSASFVAQIPGLHGKRVVCSMPLERARNP